LEVYIGNTNSIDVCTTAAATAKSEFGGFDCFFAATAKSEFRGFNCRDCFDEFLGFGSFVAKSVFWVSVVPLTFNEILLGFDTVCVRKWMNGISIVYDDSVFLPR
jgi:hypothetical protein